MDVCQEEINERAEMKKEESTYLMVKCLCGGGGG